MGQQLSVIQLKYNVFVISQCDLALGQFDLLTVGQYEPLRWVKSSSLILVIFDLKYILNYF